MRHGIELEQRRRRQRLWPVHGVTTPTSLFARLTGTETWTDAVNFGTGAHTFGGGCTWSAAQALAAGSTVGGYPLDSATRKVTVAAATTTLTVTQALHAGRFILVQSTGGLAVTPPAATGTFDVYTFLVAATVTGGSFTIDPKAGNASDVAHGVAFQVKEGTGLTSTPTVANTNLLTFTGSTTGGLKGDWIQMIDVATNCWNVLVVGTYSGTFATPFSNH